MVMMSRDSMMIVRAGTCKEGRASASGHAALCKSCWERAAPGCGCCRRFRCPPEQPARCASGQAWPRRRLCGQQRHRPCQHLAKVQTLTTGPALALSGLQGGGNSPAGPRLRTPRCAQSAPYLVEDADDDGVEEADARHAHQAEQKQVGLAVELEVGGLRVQDGAHQLPFRSAETCNREDPQRAGRKGGLSRTSALAWPQSCQGGLEAAAHPEEPGPRAGRGSWGPRAAPSSGGNRV